MEFNRLVQERYSVRKFSDRPIGPELIEKILAAARLAPTACNNQPQRILVLESREARQKAALCTPCHFNAPVMLLICYDTREAANLSINDLNFGLVDASIATAHMMLQAADLGIGSTWVGCFDQQKTQKLFALPDHIVPAAFLPLGYPAPDAKPADLHYIRKPLEELVTYL